MAYIHVCTTEAWKKIQSDGYLKPKKDVFQVATGGDVDKVSVFFIDDTSNTALLQGLRSFFVESKRMSPFAPPLSEDDFVVLQIDDSSDSIEWVEYPGQKKEMLPPFGSASQDLVKQIGEYWKTSQPIPVSLIKKIVMP